jgi:ribA/ribD-fused uncharacterized protein
MEKIEEFRGEYRFLSNFFPSPFVFDNMEWSTVEHAYQASKSLDLKVRVRINLMNTPGETKRAGKKLKIRPDWEEVKIDLMTKFVTLKFSQNPDLAKRLKQTGNMILEEGNTWHDTFWGVCPPGSNKGQNELGKILMQVRNTL